MLPDLKRSTDVDLAELSKKLLCVVRCIVPAKLKYETPLEIARKADTYAERFVDENTLEIVVAYSREKKSAQLASMFLESIRVHGWLKAIVFTNGRVLQNKHSLNNMLSCYLTAAGIENHESHCHVEIDDPFPEPELQETSLTVSFDDSRAHAKLSDEKWLLPCAHLDGFLLASKKTTGEPIDRLLAVAQDRNCNLCPFFDASKFSKLGQRFWR